MPEPVGAPRFADPTPIRPAEESGAPLAPLPRPLTSFISRDREQEDIIARLQQDDVRLLTLTGPGGAGKTRLAIHIAGALQDDFSAIWFVPLAQVADADLFLPALARALGLRETSRQELLGRLSAFIGDRRALLVLDNFEQLVEAGPQLTSLLEACPRLKTLVTTRALLRVSGEFDYRVPPLDVPDPRSGMPLDVLAGYPAIRLFVARARAADPAFELTEANAADVASICRAVDGLPLAIELAAAQTRLFSSRSLLQHLDRRLAVLIEGPHDQPARLQTMRNAIAWSYDLLATEQQSLLRCMSVFSGGFTEDALAAVCFEQPYGNSRLLQQLRGLFDHSLLLRSPPTGGDQRFFLLETIREFGLEHLAADGEEERLRSAHARYYLDLAASAEPRLIVVGSAGWVERLTVERSNIREAVRWALEQGDSEPVLRLAGTLLSMAYARGEPAEGLSWLDSALARPSTAPPEVIADALFTASALAQVQGDFDRSEELATKSRSVARGAGYCFGEGRALIGLGISAEWRGELDIAAGHYGESLALMEQSDRSGRLSHWSVLPLANLADIALLKRDFQAAIDLGQQAVDAWREAGYLWGIAQALGTVAAASCERGDLRTSRDAYGEVLDLWVACADGRGIAGAIAGIAGLSLAAGRTEEAARLLGAAENARQALSVQFVAHHLYAEQVLATARLRLDGNAFDRHWTDGRRLGVDEAVSECRSVLATLADGQPRFASRGLSTRELEVLQLIAAGHPDREIALALSISPRTVQSHVTGILTKLNAHSRSEAAAIAVRRGLV